MSVVLVVNYLPDYGPPDVWGPFDSVATAQIWAEGFRSRAKLPVEATSENNDAWTDLGWYFGIVELNSP